MPSRTAHEERRPRQRAVYNEHEYASFRSSIPLRKILTSEVSTQPWVSFDAGPKSVRCPLVFLPPVCGGADCFYKQLIALSAKGYRVIALEWPPCWDTAEWCRSLLIVLDVLRARKVHLFGASLGGFLAQKFAETYPTRTASLILCNTFSDTGIFHRHESSFFYRMFPGLLLKKLVLSGLPGKAMERDIAASVDFMVDNSGDLTGYCRFQLEGLTQQQLASRMTLNCFRQRINTSNLQRLPTTIVDVFDDCALSRAARDNLRFAYPDAKRAHLKTGGNFPFLSRSAEVDLFIEIHLRQFDDTEISAKESDVEQDL